MPAEVEDWEKEVNTFRRAVPRASIIAEEEEEQPAQKGLGTPSRGNGRTLGGGRDDDVSDLSQSRATEEKDDLDEEKDDEKEDKWIEFTDRKGQKLYYNPVTGQVNMNAAAPPKDDEEDDDEDAPKQEGRAPWSLGDDYKEKKEIKKEKEPMSVDKCVTALKLMEKQVDLMLSQSQFLSPTVCDDLRDIRAKVQKCQKSLNDAGTVDERDDIAALIDWAKLEWDFDNHEVAYYRASAARVNHKEFEYTEWHMPQAFSEWPLPAEVKGVTATVRLAVMGPAAENADNNMTSTKVAVNETTTVNKCIRECLTKCKGLNLDANELCLKVSGFNDWLYGDRPMYDYEYVRMSIREGHDLKLVLMKRPLPIPAPAGKDLPAEYRKNVDPSIEVITPETHRNLGVRDWTEMKAIPMSEAALPFRLRIIGVDNLNEQSLPTLDPLITSIYLKIQLFHGMEVLPDASRTTAVLPLTEAPRWMTWLFSEYSKELLINQLPRSTRLGVILFGRRETDKQDVMLGWAVHQLVDSQGKLCSGSMDIRLWGFAGKKKKAHGKKRELEPDFIFRATNRENWSVPNPAILRVKFDEFALPIVAPLSEKIDTSRPLPAPSADVQKALPKAQKERLEELKSADVLMEITADDRALIYKMRFDLTGYPSMLPKFLQTVQWGKQDQRHEAIRLMWQWAAPTPAAALELLDYKYPDYHVREYAVNILKKLKDDELRLYLLQLVQVLKFEPYHDSPLMRFLIERAVRSPFEIGHHLFWHVKSELHNPLCVERFALLLEEYLAHCGRFAAELRKQNSAVLKLQAIAEMIVRLKREHAYTDEDAMKEYTKEIEKLNEDFFQPNGKFQISLNPRLEATTLIVQKCRYMSSKMVPLWLVFKNADPDAPNIYVIFKSGDDLRQDILTLQVLRAMDKTWLAGGLDMRLKPYRVISTGVNDHGEGVGMIEVVMDSDTTSGIQLRYGGGAMGALKDDPIDLFLREHNKASPALMEKAVQNFVRSCAGYCVATFVLGIGDRHNGNIMVTKDGHLFHIDFGHFLGNFKKKLGVNRERAAFVFTPEMAYVMGGSKYRKHEHFKAFKRLCSESFRILRINASIFESLFALMVAAGMPELMKEPDILYLRDKLHLGVPEKTADKRLHEEIEKSLNCTYRRVDNLIHNVRHG